MDLTLVSIIVLASMIFILSGMVGYLYWQQTRLAQNVQSLAIAFTSHLTPTSAPVEVEAEEGGIQEVEITEDDRVSVEEAQEETIEHVEAAPAAQTHVDDIDDYQTKTTKQLQEILAKKGVPFGKRDSKSALLELLKAIA